MINHQNKKMLERICAAIFIVMISIIPAAAFAQTPPNPATNPTPTYTPLEPLPCIQGRPNSGLDCTGGSKIDFQKYVQYAFNLFIYISAGAAVFMIVWGGFEYMTTESWTGKGASLERIKNAILGLILVLSSYLLLRTIDPRLVAIPSTLVKPLNIPYSATTLSTISELDRQADAYFEQNAAAKAKITATKATLASQTATKGVIQGEIAALGAEMHLPQTTPEGICRAAAFDESIDSDIRDACLRLARIDSEINSTSASIATQQVIAGMLLEQGKCIETKPIDIQGCTAVIESARAYDAAKMGAMGQGTSEINDYAISAKAAIQIAGISQQWKEKELRAADYGLLLTIQNDALKKITSGAAKENITQITTNLIISLGGTQEQITSGAYLKAYGNRDVYTSDGLSI